MIRIVISNQRGGVAKTTTTHTLARYLCDKGMRVLIVDTDSQGSIGVALGLKPINYLHHFVVNNIRFTDCIVQVRPNLDVLCSNRETVETEAVLMGRTGRELTFRFLFEPIENDYDAILFDVAPSINLLQTCSMIYAQQLLVPVSMDPLSLQGAAAAIETSNTLNKLFRTSIRPVAFLPTMVDRRLGITDVVLNALEQMASRYETALLPSIRIDAAVTKAIRKRQFLMDFDPKCRALEDYAASFDHLHEDVLNGRAQAQTEV